MTNVQGKTMQATEEKPSILVVDDTPLRFGVACRVAARELFPQACP